LVQLFCIGLTEQKHTQLEANFREEIPLKDRKLLASMKASIKWEQDSNESTTRMEQTTNSVVESNENDQCKNRTNNSVTYPEIQSLNSGIAPGQTNVYRQSLNQNSELYYRVRQSPAQRILGETELPVLTAYQAEKKIVYSEASPDYAFCDPKKNVKPSASYHGLSSNRVPRAHLDSNSGKTFAKSNGDETKSTSFKTIEDSEFAKSSVGRPTRIRTPVRENMRSTMEYAKGRKKGTSDDRWGKRFIWPDDLHSDFVSAIFDIGLKQSSPSIIFETMVDKKGITLADIKNHLQKYQLFRSKSKQGFQPNLDQSIGTNLYCTRLRFHAL
jgi:SHAQKYF class myb-like DNA-binding protein